MRFNAFPLFFKQRSTAVGSFFLLKARAMSKQRRRGWGALFALTIVCSFVMQWLRFPASGLLGGMIAGILVALYIDGIRVPGPLFQFAQGVIGMMVAMQMPPDFFEQLGLRWPVIAGGAVWTIGVSVFLGWFIARRRVFPGTTGIWGVLPGAATSMIVISESNGGDIRLVAFIQYFRNISVVLLVTAVARIFAGVSVSAAPARAWLAAPDRGAFLSMLGVMAASLLLARRLRLPGGSILLPMFVGMLLSCTGAVRMETAPWLVTFATTLIGWSVGLRFTRPVLRHAAKSVPAVALSSCAILFLCGLFSVFLWWQAGVDPLTAYLAASPGGLDTVAIVAASAGTDVSFILAMHTARFILVLVTGPFLARWVARHVEPETL